MQFVQSHVKFLVDWTCGVSAATANEFRIRTLTHQFEILALSTETTTRIGFFEEVGRKNFSTVRVCDCYSALREVSSPDVAAGYLDGKMNLRARFSAMFDHDAHPSRQGRIS